MSQVALKNKDLEFRYVESSDTRVNVLTQLVPTHICIYVQRDSKKRKKDEENNMFT